MRKFIFTLLIGLTSLMVYGQDPVVLKIANVEVAPGTTTATVDVTIDGFVNMQSAAFSLNYDSLVLRYGSITNFNTALGLSISNFGTPGTGSIKPGRIRFLWDTPMANGQTVPNGTRLFSIVFDILGGPGSMSAITQSNVDYVRNLMQVTNFSSQNGSVRVTTGGGGGGGGFVDPCPNVTCASPTRLLFYGDTIFASPGQQFKMPIRVKNFKDIQTGDGSFSFDSTKLKFISIKSDVLTGAGMVFATPPAIKNGTIRYSYFDNDGLTKTVADGTVVFEITFEKISVMDDTSRVCIGREPVPVMDWAAVINGTAQSVPFCIQAGTVIGRTNPAPPVRFKLNTTSGAEGSTVCLDVTVENFIMIQNVQFSINWNPAHLEYISTGMYGLSLNPTTNFNNTDSTLTFSWNTIPPLVTLPNGHKIFQICFRLVGDCIITVPVQITSTPREIEVVGTYDGENDYEFGTEITNGAITITCGDPSICNINSTTNTSCFGSADGAVSATVTPAQGLTNCMCVWKNSAGVVIKSTANLADCNLANVAAGSYTLELICSGTQQCTSNAVVGQPDRINIPGTGITNEACGTKGSINVTGITGGNPPYNTFTWNPNVGTTANVTNLDAGTYMLTVTDSKGCTGTQSFVVTSSNTPLSGTAVATPVKCFGGNDGAITVTPSGGCPPYTITPAVNNLTAGSYTVTITDSSVPVNTHTITNVMVTQPSAPLTIMPDPQNTQAGMSTGRITLTIAGGTQNYNIVWSSNATQIAANTNPATNLSVGTYSVTVTDANGCTAVALDIEIGEDTGPAELVKFETVGVSSNFNGFGVNCNGNCNGVISGNLADGTLPVRLVLKIGNVILTERNVTALGPFEFNNLCAGNYTIEGINAAGTTISGAVTVTTPSRLIGGNPAIQCVTEGESDGSISLNITTGVAPYTYAWSTPGSITNVLSGLEVGTYAVTVTDANNCVITLGNLDVRPCNVVDDECGKGNLLLTPNGDQHNDNFVITCSEDLNGTLSIYDRWGRLVYNKMLYDNTFIGIDNNNNELIEGSYIWIYEVNYGNGLRETFNGTLTLLK
jgi:gliding motility-associated-like protein